MKGADVLPRISKTEYFILDLLRAGGEMYGLEMVKASGGALKRGTVYVTLNRMVEKKLLTSRKEEDKAHPGLPRPAYRITGLGAAALQAQDVMAAALGGGVADV